MKAYEQGNASDLVLLEHLPGFEFLPKHRFIRGQCSIAKVKDEIFLSKPRRKEKGALLYLKKDDHSFVQNGVEADYYIFYHIAEVFGSVEEFFIEKGRIGLLKLIPNTFFCLQRYIVLDADSLNNSDDEDYYNDIIPDYDDKFDVDCVNEKVDNYNEVSECESDSDSEEASNEEKDIEENNEYDQVISGRYYYLDNKLRLFSISEENVFSFMDQNFSPEQILEAISESPEEFLEYFANSYLNALGEGYEYLEHCAHDDMQGYIDQVALIKESTSDCVDDEDDLGYGDELCDSDEQDVLQKENIAQIIDYIDTPAIQACRFFNWSVLLFAFGIGILGIFKGSLALCIFSFIFLSASIPTMFIFFPQIFPGEHPLKRKKKILPQQEESRELDPLDVVVKEEMEEFS